MSTEPHKDREFLKKIELRYNNQTKRNMVFSKLMRTNKAIEFNTIKRIIKLSRYNWIDIEKNIISIGKKKKEGKINNIFPIKINKRLGSIIGHILGDGSIDKKYQQVFYTNQDKDLILEFRDNMNSIFNIKPRIWLQKPGRFKENSRWIRRIQNIKEIPEKSQIGLFYPSICGEILNIIFGNFAIGKHKKITEIMINCPKDFKIGLIRAFFDDEGHMDKERGPRFHQDNREILEKIKIMLSELKIHSFPVRKYIRKGKARHFCNIKSKKNYKRYYEVIGCTSKKKMKVLNKLIV
jgi:hypothetical protein